MKSSFLKFPRSFVKALIFVACLLLSFRIIFPIFEEFFTKREFPQIPDHFPIVVFVDQKPEVIEYSMLDDFSKDNPNYSLTSSVDKLEKLRKQFEQENKDKDYRSYFNYKIASDGKLIFQVHGISDGDRVDRCEYEVDDTQIIPIFHTYYFGPVTSLPLLPATVGLASLFYWVIKKAFRQWQKARHRMRPESNNLTLQS